MKMNNFKEDLIN